MNELDRALGKSGYTSRIVRNERVPRADSLVELAQALRVPGQWLIQGSFAYVGGAPLETFLLQKAPRIRDLFSQVDSQLTPAAADVFLRFCLQDHGAAEDSDCAARITLALHLLSVSALGYIPTLAHLNIEDCFVAADRYLKGRSRVFLSDLTDIEQEALYLVEHAHSALPWPHLHKEDAATTNQESVGHRTFADADGWVEAVAHARQLYPTTPDEFFELVGRAPLLADVGAEPQLVGELARSYYEARLRSERRKN